MKRFVLGIDVGTSSVKCVAAPLDGGKLRNADAAYSHSTPHPGWAEQDPQTWWDAAGQCVRALLTEQPEVRNELAAVAVCGQGAAAVLLDREFRPTRPAILWMDARSAPQARVLMEAAGEEITHGSGKRPAAYNVEPKLLWVSEHEPNVWRRTAHVLTTTSYITYRLTGRAIMNRSDAGILLSYDLRERNWSPLLQRRMGIPTGCYPPVAGCEDVIGEIDAEAAAMTGIRAGTPVLAGGEDTSAAALAAGVDSPGSAILSLGTAGTIYSASPQVATHPRLLAFPHVLPDLTLIGGSTICGGSGLTWMAKLLGGGQHARNLPELAHAADTLSEAGSRLVFLPYLSGELQPVNDGFARGVFFGADFSTTPEEMMAAVMQGSAFAFAHNLKFTREVFRGPERLVAAGAPSRNRPFMQTVADATGLPVAVLAEGGGAALGAALLAARAVAGPAATHELSQAWRSIEYRVTPREARRARMAELFDIYQELYRRLEDLFPRLQPSSAALCQEAG